MDEDVLSRRTLLRGAAVAGVGAGERALVAQAPPARGPSMIGVPFEETARPRFGIIGLGNRGGAMVSLLLAVPGARVTALCDIRPDLVAKAARVVTDAGGPRPALYAAGDEDFGGCVTATTSTSSMSPRRGSGTRRWRCPPCGAASTSASSARSR